MFQIASLLEKDYPEGEALVKADFVGFKIPAVEFVVGFSLDYNELKTVSLVTARPNHLV